MKLTFACPRIITMAVVTAVATLLVSASVASITPPAAQAETASPAAGAQPASSGDPTAIGTGQVYYIDSVSGDDAASGTATTTAWKTLAKVGSSSYAPGDVIAFHRGQTFTGSATVNSAGTTEAPITLTAYGTGDQPVLTNPGQLNMLVLDAPNLAVSDLAFEDGVVFDNSDGLGIQGPKYERSGAVAITSNGTAAVVRDNVFTRVGVGVKTYGADSVIEHNNFEDLRIAFRGMDSGSETSYGALGVSINNSGVRASYNRFIDCRSTDSPYGADGGAFEIEGFAHDKNNITLDHNYSRGSQGFLEVTETTSSNVTLSYNISDDYQQFIAWDTTTHPSGYLAVNNTIVRSHDASRLFDQYYYREAGPEPTADWITIRNNIFVASAWLTFHDFPRDHNLYSPGVGLDVPLGTGDLVADPLLTDVAGHNVSPTVGSPAIDNGAASLSSEDILGNPTGVGSATDIGAVEFQDVPTLEESVVLAGGFESMSALSAHSSPWSTTGDLWFGIDSDQGKAHTGTRNAWIVGQGTYWGAIEQTVTVTPNTNYLLTAWLRGADEVDSAWIGARTEGGETLAEMRVGHAPDYTRYSLLINTGSSSAITVFAGMWSPNGGQWLQLDDIELQQASYPIGVVAPTSVPSTTPAIGGGSNPSGSGGGTGESGSPADSSASVAAGKLADTGAPVGSVIALALALLVVGGIVLRHRRVWIGYR